MGPEARIEHATHALRTCTKTSTPRTPEWRIVDQELDALLTGLQQSRWKGPKCPRNTSRPERRGHGALDTAWYIHNGQWRYTGSMGKRLVDIDDALLEEATRILGAGTMKEAVNRSLEEVVSASRRRRHAQRLSDLRDLDLDDPDVMEEAWR